MAYKAVRARRGQWQSHYLNAISELQCLPSSPTALGFRLPTNASAVVRLPLRITARGSAPSPGDVALGP